MNKNINFLPKNFDVNQGDFNYLLHILGGNNE